MWRNLLTDLFLRSAFLSCHNCPVLSANAEMQLQPFSLASLLIAYSISNVFLYLYFNVLLYLYFNVLFSLVNFMLFYTIYIKLNLSVISKLCHKIHDINLIINNLLSFFKTINGKL